MGVTRPSARVDNTRFAARRTPVSLRPRTSLLLSSVLPALACGAAPAQTAGDAGTSGSDASTTAVADDSTGESGASAPTPVATKYIVLKSVGTTAKSLHCAPTIWVRFWPPSVER